MNNGEKFLVLRPDHIGDMVLTTPFLRNLRHDFPHAEISVLCGSWSAPILEHNPNFDHLITCNYPWLDRSGRSTWNAFFSTFKALRHNQYDRIFNLRKAAKAAGAARALGGVHRYGFDLAKCGWAHTHKVRYRTDIHIADLYLEFVRSAGGTPAPSRPELFFEEEEILAARRKTRLPDDIVLIAPGAGYREKCWSPEKWAAAADHITGSWKKSLGFIGSSGERLMVDNIINRMKDRISLPPERIIDLCGALSIRETALVIRESKLLLAVDSAAMHLAAAGKTPVIALFGPTNPVHWGPYPNGTPSRTLCKTTRFRKGRGSHNISGGMDSISAGDVIAEMDGVYREVFGASPSP